MNAHKTNEQHTDPPTVERLRADIDSGKTGEKVPYPDPAAAPLGADDEAAGNPPTVRQRREEFENKKDGPPPAREGYGSLVLYALLIAGVALVILGAFLLLRT